MLAEVEIVRFTTESGQLPDLGLGVPRPPCLVQIVEGIGDHQAPTLASDRFPECLRIIAQRLRRQVDPRDVGLPSREPR